MHGMTKIETHVWGFGSRRIRIEESEFGDSEEWEEWDYDMEHSETSILGEAEHEIRD
jgi:hypothetical protein